MKKYILKILLLIVGIFLFVYPFILLLIEKIIGDGVDYIDIYLISGQITIICLIIGFGVSILEKIKQ